MEISNPVIHKASWFFILRTNFSDTWKLEPGDSGKSFLELKVKTYLCVCVCWLPGVYCLLGARHRVMSCKEGSPVAWKVESGVLSTSFLMFCCFDIKKWAASLDCSLLGLGERRGREGTGQGEEEHWESNKLYFHLSNSGVPYSRMEVILSISKSLPFCRWRNTDLKSSTRLENRKIWFKIKCHIL